MSKLKKYNTTILVNNTFVAYDGTILWWTKNCVPYYMGPRTCSLIGWIFQKYFSKLRIPFAIITCFILFILCAQWHRCLWIDHYWLPLLFSLTFMYTVIVKTSVISCKIITSRYEI